jgi:formate hydrogenlyase subunit 5
MARPATTLAQVDTWRVEVLARVRRGERFAGLFGTARSDSCQLTALLVGPERIDALDAIVEQQPMAYESLTPDLRAAFWYERALHDLSGVVPRGHPRLDPLLLPLPAGAVRPQPGRAAAAAGLGTHESRGPVDVSGRGMFSIPHGPVRSGVFESIEYLVETPGEDIPHLNIRPHYKHRGMAKRFEGLNAPDGVLVAERVEGVASVAHALAFCHAVESLSGAEVPGRARLIRVVHAELERVANHLDVAMRLCDAAGLAVAAARFGWHKETVLRLISQLCGSRFGRGVVVPGGVSAEPGMSPSALVSTVGHLRARIASDARALMVTSTFLDRLRKTGPLDAELAREHGALGPIGRASGYDDDHRRLRPYDAYPELDLGPAPDPADGDALARLKVRWIELERSFDLIAQCIGQLEHSPGDAWRVDATPPDGRALGWAESPQGEVVYSVEMRGGRIVRCLARTASFHNLFLFHDVFRGDILTDFPFIEASFGLSPAGVAM